MTYALDTRTWKKFRVCSILAWSKSLSKILILSSVVASECFLELVFLCSSNLVWLRIHSYSQCLFYRRRLTHPQNQDLHLTSLFEFLLSLALCLLTVKKTPTQQLNLFGFQYRFEYFDQHHPWFLLESIQRVDHPAHTSYFSQLSFDCLFALNYVEFLADFVEISR